MLKDCSWGTTACTILILDITAMAQFSHCKRLCSKDLIEGQLILDFVDKQSSEKSSFIINLNHIPSRKSK